MPEAEIRPQSQNSQNPSKYPPDNINKDADYDDDKFESPNPKSPSKLDKEDDDKIIDNYE